MRIVSSKTHRTREIPLAVRVGQAITKYLHHGRPATSCRNLFVRHRILQGTPVSKAVIREVIRDAYAKVTELKSPLAPAAQVYQARAAAELLLV